ncbi:AAA family ATPase [Falsiroseomonas sp. E2-1-a4]|uniref:AAA family ATPase n=1 Tax=Falsiroseomonas sp. E2-1-a4 TaxID=3239299 RepID=UPI003F417CD0
MLRTIRIENFKAFGEAQEIPVGPITLIYGPNSAGKSSIIQSLLLMRQSLQSVAISESRLLFSGEDVNLGNYTAALHGHNAENKMKLGFSFSSRSQAGFTRGFFRGAVKSVDIELDYPKAAQRENVSDAWITNVKYGVHDRNAADLSRDPLEVELVRLPLKKGEVPDLGEGVTKADFRPRNAASSSDLLKLMMLVNEKMTPEGSQASLKVVPPDPALVKSVMAMKFFSYGFLPFRIDFSQIDAAALPSAIRYMISSPYSPLEILRRDFVDEMSNISYLGPLRSPPARHYIISGSDKHSVGSRGERMPQILYRKKRMVIPRINEKLSEFGIPYVLDIQSAGNTLTGDIIAIALSDQRNVVVSPSDVGFGIGQLLPILVEGIVSAGKTICVEQPEIHLHPRLQAHLADFFIETAKTQSESSRVGRPASEGRYGGNQWIIETHSEALILRLQTLIRNKTIPASFVTVLYVEPTSYGGARVLRLKLSEEGEFIDEWPHGFFEESFHELFSGRR